jgi:protein-disulfide isomerase
MKMRIAHLRKRGLQILLGLTTAATLSAALAAGSAQIGEVRPANALGPASAPVTIEFFSDLQCPQCARFEPIVKQLKMEFGDRVRLVLRHFPLDTHENAALAACAAEAAANQHKFWEMVEALYKTQWMWGRAPAPRAILADEAKQVGLDLDKFEQDIDSPQCRSRVGSDSVYAESIGVKTAPSVVINGYNVPNSEFSEDGFRAAINAALAKSRQ